MTDGKFSSLSICAGADVDTADLARRRMPAGADQLPAIRCGRPLRSQRRPGFPARRRVAAGSRPQLCCQRTWAPSEPDSLGSGGSTRHTRCFHTTLRPKPARLSRRCSACRASAYWANTVITCGRRATASDSGACPMRKSDSSGSRNRRHVGRGCGDGRRRRQDILGPGDRQVDEVRYNVRQGVADLAGHGQHHQHGQGAGLQGRLDHPAQDRRL